MAGPIYSWRNSISTSRFYGAQTPVYLIHQRVDAGRERFYVASGIILSHSRISSREFEPVYKVKLKPVDIPVAESRLIQIA